ncbi:MAG: hypothetical protein ACW98Y_07915 [Candidatus Thorarchaeota archaeon]|jgi:hypothetical protein
MSDEIISEFFEYLISSAEENRENMGNPLFLLATLQYIIKNNLHGISFNELMYKQHTRHIKELFFRVARSRTDDPENTWRILTNPRNPEMQNLTRQYITDYGDVSKAFSELKPSKAKLLLDSFIRQINVKSSLDISS